MPVTKIFDASRPLLPEILALHEKWHASKPAIRFGGEMHSWTNLGENTNKVAHGLHAQGLKKNDTVAVLMGNCLETVEILIGILKAGCVSVPINLSITDDAIQRMLQDADVKAVFVTPDQQLRLTDILQKSQLTGKIHCFTTGQADETWQSYVDWKSAFPATPLDIDLSPDDPLNIIYSSGTTGQPKGILHTHQTRLDWAYDLAIALRYHGGAKTLCNLSLYSNISWVMLLCTLLAGGTLIIDDGFEAGRTLALIERHGVTHTAMVPVQFQRIVAHENFIKSDKSYMQAMMSCGSPLYTELKQQILESFPCGIIELYGLTEGVITTLAPEDAVGKLSSVGKPLIGTDIRLIGDDDRPVGAGESGEIVSRGRITMPGYHNREDASKEAVWKDEQGKTWLRTGDLGKLDEDGFLYIVDRKKDMIISGGQNIYPADIEAIIVQHKSVTGAAVIGIPHPDWGETPFAYLEVTADTPTSDELLSWINENVGKRQRLAGVKIVAELPRNPNGKILKRELREQHQAG